MPHPTRNPIPVENQPARPGADAERPPGKDSRPARELQDGAFDDSVAGEEDPGAGVDALVPKHER